MAVVSVKILHDGWTGSFPSTEAPTFTVVYLVEVDDPQDGNMTVVSADGIPALGSAYSVGQDFRADVLLKSLSTAPVAGTRNLWNVTASYGKPEKEEENDDPTDGITEDGEPTADPLKFAVSMSISSTRVARDAIMGTYLGQLREREGVAGNLVPDGFNEGGAPPQAHGQVEHDQWESPPITNGRAITNSVFKPFDPPPQVEYNRTNLRINFNTLNSPQRILPYINSVNSKGIVINVFYHWDDEHGQDRASRGKFYIPEFAGRIMGMTTNPSRRNGIAYHENELEIEVDAMYTWRLDILDRGYATLNAEKTFTSYAEGKGVAVTNSDVSEDGFANREPVLLDGRGQELNIEEADAVYLRYGVYPEMDWHRVGLQEPRRLQGAD
tara:strand:+ start:723 stop:1871 length:1149 start_codon:yes stop_codon:yes gene_type:complete